MTVTLRMPRRVEVKGSLKVLGQVHPSVNGVWMAAKPGPGGTWISCDKHGRFTHKLEPGLYDAWMRHSDGDWHAIEVEVPDTPTFTMDLDAQ